MTDKQGKTLTLKQQQMLDHIQSAKQLGQSFSHYAKEHGLNEKALYNYHWVLRKKGLFGESTGVQPFVKITNPKRPAHNNITATIYFPNGIHVDILAQDNTLATILQQVQSL